MARWGAARMAACGPWGRNRRVGAGDAFEASEVRRDGRSRMMPACGPWGAGHGGGDPALERELSRDGSHYSISSAILPSLGARSNRRIKLRRFIISPYDRRYRLVRNLLCLSLPYRHHNSRRCFVSDFFFLAQSLVYSPAILAALQL